MGGSAGRQLSTVSSREANSGHVDSLAPLERAIQYPGQCCICRKQILMAAIRCDEHEIAYRKAKWDLAMGAK